MLAVAMALMAFALVAQATENAPFDAQAAIDATVTVPTSGKIVFHQTNTNCPEANDVDLQMQHWQEETWSNASVKDKMCEAFRNICIYQGQFLYEHKDGQPPPFST